MLNKTNSSNIIYYQSKKEVGKTTVSINLAYELASQKNYIIN